MLIQTDGRFSTLTGRRAMREADSQLRQSHSTRSVDHLVRAQEQPLRDREAERLGGLGVDHELKFRWLLDRQITGFRALQNLVDKSRRLPPDLVDIRTVGYQSTGVHVLPE